ncbi:MAG: hypothetical protein JSW27_12565 [Phycisphaerales bacterium]|nr:MAG: hypothetical protein JSW27_12565 [Phycisphaerales bacterium]
MLFFTGSERGALKPCGCSGGQLGGLSKRAAIFNAVPSQSRMILDAGDLVADDGEQDLIKFGVLFEAYQLLGYDVVHLTERDVEIGHNLGLLRGRDYAFEIISSHWDATRDDRPWAFRKHFAMRGRDVFVNVASFDAQIDTAERAAIFFDSLPEARNVNVLILQNCPVEARKHWAERSGAHCLLCPIDSDDPQVLSEPDTNPVVISPGRLGRHIVRLQVNWPESNTGPTLHFEDVPVEETLPEDEVLVHLYRQYQQLVGESQLLENYPRVPLPDDLRFVGSENCASCHEYEYSRWKTKAHADAFATLAKVGSNRDPECVVCHVVGMDRASGFVTEEKTPEMKNVGCENCHGPGSEHVRTWGQAVTVEPRATCRDCHTPEHSSGFAGHEAEYMQKIVHWREP